MRRTDAVRRIGTVLMLAAVIGVIAGACSSSKSKPKPKKKPGSVKVPD